LFQSIRGFVEFPFEALDLGFERVHLRAQRNDFDALTVGQERALAELGGELEQRGLLVGERARGVVQRLGPGADFFFGRAGEIAQRFLARFERKDRAGFVGKLALEPVDRLGLLAEFRELARGACLELVDADLEPSRRHRKLGPQLVLVGLDLRHGQRRCSFEAADGEADGAIMDERDEHKPDQACEQEADRKIHDRFDHHTLRYRLQDNATTTRGSPVFPGGEGGQRNGSTNRKGGREKPSAADLKFLHHLPQARSGTSNR
jgi:hypothetical protein